MEWLTHLVGNPVVRRAAQALAVAILGALLGPPLGVPDAQQLGAGVHQLVQSALF